MTTNSLTEHEQIGYVQPLHHMMNRKPLAPHLISFSFIIVTGRPETELQLEKRDNVPGDDAITRWKGLQPLNDFVEYKLPYMLRPTELLYKK